MTDEELERLNWRGMHRPDLFKYANNDLVVYERYSFALCDYVPVLSFCVGPLRLDWAKLTVSDVDRFFMRLTPDKVEFALCETLERAVKI
jgi:hypothetical protein